MGCARLIGGVVVGAVVACAGVAAGQGVTAVPQVVAQTTVVDVRTGTTQRLLAPRVTSSGYVAYGVALSNFQLTTPSVANEAWRARVGDSPVAPTQLITMSTPVPDRTSNVTFTGVAFGTSPGFRTLMLADDGRIAISAPVGSGGVTSYVTVAEVGGPLGARQVMRSGLSISGLPTVSVASVPAPTPLGWSGTDVFSRASAGPGWLSHGDRLVMRSQGANAQTLANAVAMNGAGQLLEGPQDGSLARRREIDGSFTPIAAVGQQIPGLAEGTTYQLASALTFNGAQLNNHGEAAFLGRTSDAAADSQSLFLASSTAARRVVTTGQQAPALPDGVTIGSLAPTTATGSAWFAAVDGPGGSAAGGTVGRVAFLAGLAGAGVTTTNDTALYITTPTGVALVAREGQYLSNRSYAPVPAPNEPPNFSVELGAIHGAFFNARGEALIVAVDDLNSPLLLAYDPVQGLRRLSVGLSGLPSTDPFTSYTFVAAGVPGTSAMTATGSPLVVSTAGSFASPLADDGRFALAVYWSGGSAIVTGFIPAPGAAGVVVLAGCVAMRRRRVV